MHKEKDAKTLNDNFVSHGTVGDPLLRTRPGGWHAMVNGGTSAGVLDDVSEGQSKQ